MAAVDFGIRGRINRQARYWLAEILYGLTTGNYRRVAEIHFEAQYVPDYHNVEEFATALRAVGEQKIGRAHVCTPVTNAHLVCPPLLEKKKNITERDTHLNTQHINTTAHTDTNM